MQQNNPILNEKISSEVAVLIPTALLQKVVSPATLAKADEIRRSLKAMVTLIKDFFKPLKENAHKAWRSLCDAENAEIEKINPALKYLDKEVGDYLAAQERIRREAQEKVRREQEEAERKRLEALQAAIEAEKAGKSEEAERILEEGLAPVPKVEVPAAIKLQGTSIRRLPRWRVSNFNDIPRELLRLDESKITEIVNRDKEKTSIPGIVFYWETSTVTRGI